MQRLKEKFMKTFATVHTIDFVASLIFLTFVINSIFKLSSDKLDGIIGIIFNSIFSIYFMMLWIFRNDQVKYQMVVFVDSIIWSIFLCFMVVGSIITQQNLTFTILTILLLIMTIMTIKRSWKAYHKMLFIRRCENILCYDSDSCKDCVAFKKFAKHVSKKESEIFRILLTKDDGIDDEEEAKKDDKIEEFI